VAAAAASPTIADNTDSRVPAYVLEPPVPGLPLAQVAPPPPVSLVPQPGGTFKVLRRNERK